jgi:predicted DNA-binding antitoxin AbrB/MazE fold protein
LSPEVLEWVSLNSTIAPPPRGGKRVSESVIWYNQAMPPQTFQAVYEKGVLRPLKPLQGLAENDRVTVTVTVSQPQGPLAAVIGTMPDADANELRDIIEAEFERVDPDEWK